MCVMFDWKWFALLCLCSYSVTYCPDSWPHTYWHRHWPIIVTLAQSGSSRCILSHDHCSYLMTVYVAFAVRCRVSAKGSSVLYSLSTMYDAAAAVGNRHTKTPIMLISCWDLGQVLSHSSCTARCCLFRSTPCAVQHFTMQHHTWPHSIVMMVVVNNRGGKQ